MSMQDGIGRLREMQSAINDVDYHKVNAVFNAAQMELWEKSI